MSESLLHNVSPGPKPVTLCAQTPLEVQPGGWAWPEPAVAVCAGFSPVCLSGLHPRSLVLETGSWDFTRCPASLTTFCCAEVGSKSTPHLLLQKGKPSLESCPLRRGCDALNPKCTYLRNCLGTLSGWGDLLVAWRWVLFCVEEWGVTISLYLSMGSESTLDSLKHAAGTGSLGLCRIMWPADLKEDPPPSPPNAILSKIFILIHICPSGSAYIKTNKL